MIIALDLGPQPLKEVPSQTAPQPKQELSQKISTEGRKKEVKKGQFQGFETLHVQSGATAVAETL